MTGILKTNGRTGRLEPGTGHGGTSETAAVTAAGASGNDDGTGQESARKKDRIKVRIGQRDDLQNAH